MGIYSGRSLLVFRRKVWSPSSGSAYSSIPKMVAVRLPETPVNLYQTTRRHIPGDGRFILHIYRHENLKSSNVQISFPLNHH
jgi:hypothetical protein